MSKKKLKVAVREHDAPQYAGKTAKRLFGQLKDQRFRLIAVAVSILIYTALNIFTPYYSAIVIDALSAAVGEAIETGSFNFAWEPLGRQMTILGVMYMVMACFYLFQSYLMASVAENLILKLRRQISNKLNKLPLRFFDANKPGEILSRVTSDLDKVSETLQTGLLKLLVAIGTIVGSLAFMFYYSWILALIFIAFMAIGVVITKIVSKKNLKAASERQEAIARLTGIAEEYYTGRDIIKAFNHEEESVNKVYKAVDEVRLSTRDADFLTNAVNPAVRFLSRLSQAVILLIAGYWMIHGQMTIGIVQAYFQYLNMSAEPITEASFMINSLQSALASAERTFEFLDDEEEIPDTTTPVNLDRADGRKGSGRPAVPAPGCPLFDGQDVDEARDLKHFLNGFVHVADDHFPLLVHHLLRGQDHPQPGGGQVVQRLKVQDQFSHPIPGALQLLLQLGRRGGVQPPLQSDVQRTALNCLADLHRKNLPLLS